METISFAANLFFLGALLGLVSFAVKRLTQKAWWFIDVVGTFAVLTVFCSALLFVFGVILHFLNLPL
jgi:putative copper export protein